MGGACKPVVLRKPTIHVALILVCCVATVSALPSKATASEGNPKEIFPLVRRIRLSTSEQRPILSVSALSFLPNGNLVVADGKAHCVHVFDKCGARLRSFGIVGDGPGEFRNLVDVLVDEKGLIFTMDAGNDRITIWDSTGQYLRDFPCRRGVGRALWLGAKKDRIATLVSTAPRGPAVVVYDRDGKVTSAFGEMSDEVERLWRMLGFPLAGGGIAAVNDTTVLIFHRAVYELRVYSASGELLRVLRKPNRSAFRPILEGPRPGDMRSVRRWERKWTRLSSVAVVPPGLVVVEMLDMSNGNERFLADILRLDGQAVRTAVEVPGLTKGVEGNGHIVFVEKLAPEDPAALPQFVVSLRVLNLQ